MTDFGQSVFGQSVLGHRVLPANFGQSVFGQNLCFGHFWPMTFLASFFFCQSVFFFPIHFGVLCFVCCVLCVCNIFALFVSLWVSSRGILVVFLKAGLPSGPLLSAFGAAQIVKPLKHWFGPKMDWPKMDLAKNGLNRNITRDFQRFFSVPQHTHTHQTHTTTTTTHTTQYNTKHHTETETERERQRETREEDRERAKRGQKG